MTKRSKILNVRTTEYEYDEIKKYASFQGVSVTDFVLTSVLEKIEDKEDLQAINDYENDNDKMETVSWDQVKTESGLL